MEFNIQKMGNIMENGLKAKSMEEELWNIMAELNMKVIGKITLFKAKEYILMKERMFTKGNLKMVLLMEKAL